MVQDILKQNDFEGLRLYEPESAMHKAISPKLRAVFEKLFRDTEINPDDFYFTAFNDEQANAFFIPTEKTLNGKNVVAISNAAVEALDSEEELAAVLAHECGHYLWSQYIKGNNTIIQERWSDLYSVDLMMNAGYNPRAILEMQKKIMGNFRNSQVSFDVHGTPFARAEDVKAYLTKIASERGDFPELKVDKFSAATWRKFRKDVKKIESSDPYYTYIQKAMLARFGTIDIKEIKRSEFIKFMIDEVSQVPESDEHGWSVRGNELISLMARIGYFRDKTQEEIEDLQELYVLFRKRFRHSGYASTLLDYAKLEEFGPFAQQRFNIENFIKYYDDKELAIYWAQQISLLSYTCNDYRKLEGIDENPYPSLNPLGADNIGRPFPWQTLLSYKDNYVNEALVLLGFGQDKFRVYSSPIYDPDEYFLENGIVIAFGEDARREHARVRDAEKYNHDKTNFEELEADIQKRTRYFDVMADYHAGVISDKEFYVFLKKENIKTETFVEGVSFGSSFKTEYFRDDLYALYNQVLQSKWYRYFASASGRHMDLVVDKDKGYTSRNIYDVITRLYSVSYDLGLFYKVREAEFKLASYLNNQTGDKESQADAFGLFMDLCGYRWHVYKDDKEYIRTQKQYRKSSLIGISNNEHVFVWVPDVLFVEIDENFEYHEKSQILGNIVKQLIGKDKISSEQDLLTVLDKILLKKPNGFETLSTWIWADYLRHGGRANISKVLDRLEHIARGHKSTSVNKILAQYITVNDFTALSLYDKLQLFEFFKYSNLFSEKAANQNAFIKIIVDEIVSCSLNDAEAVKFAFNFLTNSPNTKFAKAYDVKDFEFANEREKLIDFYATHWANRLGPDNGTDKYLESLNEFLSDMNQENVSLHKPAFTRTVKKSIANALSNKIVAQARVAGVLGRVAEEKVLSKQVEEFDVPVRTAEAAFGLLAREPKDAVACINFLGKKLSDKSMDDVTHTILTNHEYSKDVYQDYLNREKLTIIHEAFWSADLPARAYIMNRILNSYSEKDEAKLDLIVDMYFDKKSEYYKDAKLVVSAVYKNLQDYERNLILAALASAGQRDESVKTTGGQMVGQGLRMFLQAKGSAFIKFGQLLSYLPTLDSDIRKELAQLRDKANIPTRAELFDMIGKSVPNDVTADISHVGEILGAGSFYVTVRIVYKGRECVLSVMRPFAHDLTESGLDMISRTINELSVADSKYKPLKNIVNQARESSMSELDIEQDYKKYMQAKKQYERISVTVDDVKYSPDVAPWIAYGCGNDGDNAYKIMDEAPGKSLMSDSLSEQDKHEFAVAYVTLELCLLLSGVQWDTDRHMGQQNFYNESFRDVVIGIFDTGAQMNAMPNKQDKVMLGHLLYELAAGISNGVAIGEVLTRVIKNLDKAAEKLHIDTAYIDGVQRGLTALSDIMEYQKEIRDEDGNVIQESKRLTAADWQNIVTAIYKSGLIDKTVEKTVVAKAIVDKMLVWRKGIKMHGGGVSAAANPIVVEYKSVDKNYACAEKLMKAKDEVREMLRNKQGQERFGMRFVISEDVFNNKKTELSFA